MTEKKTPRLYGKLFTTMFFISAFTFGGGFVIVSLMKKKFVDELHWLEEQEMLDMTALAQSCPGAIAVNAAILAGWKMGGAAGCFFAVLGTILPPMIILSVISLFYAAFAQSPPIAALLRGMQSGVAAVIADVTWNLGSNVVKKKSAWSISIMAFSFICSFFLKINVMFIILGAALLGVLRMLWLKRRAAS